MGDLDKMDTSTVLTRATTYLLGIVALLSLVVFVIIQVKWQLQPDPLELTVYDESGQIEHYDNVVPNQELRFTRLACVTSPILVTVHREIKNLDNGAKIMLPTISYSAQPEPECFPVAFVVEVPSDICEGSFKYVPTLIYEVNPIKTITKPAAGVTFNVVESNHLCFNDLPIRRRT